LSFHKRSIFLIDPRFQLKFSLVVSSLIILSSLIYPVIMVDFFDELVASNPAATTKLFGARNELILFLLGIQVLFSAMVFILFIFMTHKIAGPLYKLRMHLSRIRQGEAITPLTFRTGDHFHDVADEVSLFLEMMTVNQEADFQYLDEVSLYIENLAPVVPDDKKPVLNEISRRLMDIKLRYKKDL
jgi:ABC-type multidrug transport system fused ATPase/permease subunit